MATLYTLHNISCGAPPWYGASSSPAHLTVAASLRLVVVAVLVEDLHVVLVNMVLKVGHAPVTDLDCIPVKNFVEWVVLGEVPGDDSQKFGPNIGFHILRVRRVEPSDPPSSVSTSDVGLVVVVCFVFRSFFFFPYVRPTF